MNTDLTSYVKVYKGFMSDELCDTTVEQLQIANWNKEEFYSPKNNSFVPPSETLDVTHDVIPNMSEINDVVYRAIGTYFIEDLNFSWCMTCTGFSHPKYNRYSNTHGMQLHCDHIHSLFTGEAKGVPILSILTLINDDFEGGEFLMFDDREIKFKKGDVMVFPSNFLYPHRVSNVTKGTRYTTISWAW
jgi:hypothetical protein